MKKLLFTTATILMIGLTAYAQDGNKSISKNEKKCDPKECTSASSANCRKSCDVAKCSKDNTSCKKVCQATEVKKDDKTGKAK